MRWFGSNKSDGIERSPGGKLKLPAIVARNIKSIATLDGPHFVFLVTFSDGEQIVLKMEMGVSGKTAASHDLGVKIMGVVSPVKAETLTKAELFEISRVDSGISMDFFRAEQVMNKGFGHWVKAAFQKNLAGFADDKSYKPQDPGSKFAGAENPIMKAEMKAKMASLKDQLKGNTKAWKSLGQIVAADMLIGNTDRFDVVNGRVQNMGNVQFKTSGKKITEAVGLDSFDPNADITDLFSGISKNGTQGFDEWKNDNGGYMKNPSSAKGQFTAMMNHLDSSLLRYFGEQSGFGEKEVAAFHSGFVEGCLKLKKKMADFSKRAMGSKSAVGTPQELIRRVAYLGWV